MSTRRRPSITYTVTPGGRPPMVIDWAGTTDPADFNMMRMAVTHHSFHRWRARKLRLFACACVRRLWDHLTVPRSRAAVEASERFADGEIDKRELTRVRRLADRAVVEAGERWPEEHQFPPVGTPRSAHDCPGWTPASAAWVCADARTRATFIPATARAAEAMARVGANTEAAEEAVQIGLLRDIFGVPVRPVEFVYTRREWRVPGGGAGFAEAWELVGNPFRPATFSPEWRTDTAVSLARRMYDARDFALMPILADALQDAGCEDADVLAHCRDPHGTHVRGCWVVDLVLGKS